VASKEEELSNGQFQIGIERDEIMQKLARKEEELDALKAVNENQEININSASDAMEKMHKELGETKIAFASREKEFMDLKQFYEENNASNLNEEERLKMELTEMNAKFIKANEKIVQLELDARTVSNERYDLIAQIDQYQKQMDNLEKSFDVHKSDEESLREEKETFLGKINALESEKNELLAVNKTVASELKEMTDLKNAQSEKVQKAVKKGKSIQADLVETKKMLTTKENELSELKQQLLNASAAAAMTTPALNEEDEKMYKALIAEKDSLIESLREQQMTVSSNLENFQNQMNDLINERNASAESMHIIESELITSRENISHVEKELGETKIALASREKEFMDLKQFYEENNASNLNEEERLKMELTEANANMKLVREDAEQLKRKLAEQETAVAFANQQHLEQIQILQATIAEARNESAQERDKAEEIKQQLETKMTELQRMKLEIDANAEKLAPSYC
jgi:chromosome segregation ATPase